ncbi:hypothetical protein IWW34DRAFT_791234 [Fusarium oxysporum f. sp. albedinis]|nr:hypothetical protein IWW34DRAFT_791234 [Fusarium oxysporum f. sp. albedinis]
MPGRAASAVARWYYDTCYRDGGYAVDCSRFSRRNIPWSEHRKGLRCPFREGACVNKTQPISFDTGHLSPLIFGKNTKEAIDITIRRRTTCSPIMPDIFATLPPSPVQGYHYFNFSVESNPKVSSLTGGTPLNVRIGRSSRNDYEVVAVARSGPYRTKAMKEPYMHPALNRSDAEIVIVLVNKEGVKYRTEVDDVLFGAHATRENFRNTSGLWYNTPDDNGYTPGDLISLHRDDREYDNWYYSDDPVGMIGCADQMEICLVPSNTCSGLVSVPSSSASLLNLFPTLRELEAFFKSFSPDTGAGFVVGSNIISHLKEFGPEVLDVRRYGLGFGDGKQNAPRSGLWENEARTWFGASIAGMQFSVVQNTAMFLLPEKRKDYKRAIKAVKGYQPSSKDCWTVKVRSSEHETLSLFGVLLLILISTIIFGVSSLDGLVQRTTFRSRPHQVLAWALDTAQQLVRQLHYLIRPVVVHPTVLDAPPTAVGTTGIPSLKRENGSHWIANYSLNRDGDTSSAPQPTLNNIAKTMTAEAEKAQLLGVGWEDAIFKRLIRWIMNITKTALRELRIWKSFIQQKI